MLSLCRQPLGVPSSHGWSRDSRLPTLWGTSELSFHAVQVCISLVSSFLCSMGVKSNVFSNPCCVIREISLFSSVSRDINALAQELGTAQETLGLVVTSVLLLQSLPQGPWLARKGRLDSSYFSPLVPPHGTAAPSPSVVRMWQPCVCLL